MEERKIEREKSYQKPCKKNPVPTVCKTTEKF
jgi:hypothetical protein